MITEAQRRALFALREALHLCEGADITVAGQASIFCEQEISPHLWLSKGAGGVDELLAEHPES